MGKRLKIALAQTAPHMGGIEKNYAKIRSFIDRARKAKADIVAFPELSDLGYLSQGLFVEAAKRSSVELNKLLPSTKGLGLVLGVAEEDDNGTLHNSAIVAEDGKRLGTYRKSYLPTYGMFEESRWFSPGIKVPVFNLKGTKVGVVICEDFWQPLPARIASLRGASIIFALSASPKTLRKPKMVDTLLRARAIENCAYVVFVNQAGSQDMVNFWGGSKIIDPNGEIVVEAKQNSEDFVTGTVDIYSVDKLRKLNPYLRDERRELIEDYYRAFSEARGDEDSRGIRV